MDRAGEEGRGESDAYAISKFGLDRADAEGFSD